MAAAAGLEVPRRRGRRAVLPRPASESLTLPDWQQAISVANVALAARQSRTKKRCERVCSPLPLEQQLHDTVSRLCTRACARASGPDVRSRAGERWQESCLTILKWCGSTVVMGGRPARAVRDATPRGASMHGSRVRAVAWCVRREMASRCMSPVDSAR